MREIAPEKPIFLGGQSYGGRQATLLVADERDLLGGLLLFSYPLHPPGKPDRLRTEHFPRLPVPAVFVEGTADPFGSVEELRSAISAIPAPTRIIAVEKAGHDLRRGRFYLGPVVTALPLPNLHNTARGALICRKPPVHRGTPCGQDFWRPSF